MSTIVLNEFLADPASDLAGDANGDGTRDASQDEFVEIVNSSGSQLDLSNWTISDNTGGRHTFPSNTILTNGQAIVVFGGETPTETFGNAIVQTASSGSLGLNNSGDTITITDNNNNDVATKSYGSEGNNNKSLTRDPDLTGSFVGHTEAAGSANKLFSPGTKIDGTTFTASAGNSLAIAATDANKAEGDSGKTSFLFTVMRTGDASSAIDVDYTVSSSEADASDFNGSLPSGNLTFAAGETEKTIAVDILGDTDLEANESFTITISNPTGDTTITTASANGTIQNDELPAITINEFLADPASDLAGDANGDGTRDASQDEFVEIVNSSGSQLDLSNWTISDNTGVRHTFPSNTILTNGQAIVVFGGGNPTGTFGNVVVQTASSGSLGLNNSGDTITLVDSNNNNVVIESYSSEGSNNKSLTRHPDLTGSFVGHTEAASSASTLFSPGTQVDGTEFDTTPPVVEKLTPVNGATDIAVDANLQIQFDESIQAGTGKIFIQKGAGSTTVETIEIGSASISGNILTIDPSSNLNHSTNYHIQIESGAIRDSAGNEYAGTNNTTSWNFTTANQAPILDSSKEPKLTAIDEDTATNNGNTVANIVVNGSITDTSVVEAIAITASDNNNKGSWQYATDSGTNWTSFPTNLSKSNALLLNETAKVRFVPNSDANGSANFTFRAWDKTSGSNGDTGVDTTNNGSKTAFSTATDTATIAVNTVNDVPILQQAIADTTATEDSNFHLDISGNFSDIDANDSLTYTANLSDGSNLPNWLDFNSETGEFSGTPSNNDVGSWDLTVTASDSSGETAEDSFQLSVSNTNDVPILQQAIADTTATEDSNFHLDISGNFSDIDANDSLTYTANLSDGSNLPNWLDFNSETGIFSGLPSNSDVGNIDIEVTASDSSGETAEDNFQLSVSNTNDVPNITSDNTVSVAENTTAVMTVAATDVDGDALTFSISGGNDANRFTTNSNTGEIIFTTSPDFENPTDSDTDNIYQVEVSADDGNTGVDIQTIQVRVTNISENNTGNETADAGNETSSEETSNDSSNENPSNETADAGNETPGDETADAGNETSSEETSNDSSNENPSNETADAGNETPGDSNETSGNKNIGDGDENPSKETSNDSGNETPSEETSNDSGNNVTEGSDDKASDKTSDSDDTGNHPTNQTPSIDHIRLEPTVTADSQISLDKDVFAEVFSDAGGSELRAIRIDSLPENGILLLDREPVKAGQTISASEFDSLVIDPHEGFAGTIEFDWNASNGDRFSLFGKSIEIEIQAAEEAAGEGKNQGVTPEDDEFAASNENNAIAALAGNDRIRGNGGNDTINGNQGEDHLEGGDGNDIIFGGQQADILNGGNGDDFLSGDLQEDTLTGGDGSDRFLLRNVSGADIIADFEDGVDALVLPNKDFPLLPNDITFEDLTFEQVQGGTVISVNGNTMAGLTGVDATNLTGEDFQQVSSI